MMWLFVVAIFMPIMMGTCEETVANKTAVTWAHAVNSQEKLTHALDSKVNAIEADVVMGTLTGKRQAEAEAGDEELKKKDPKPPKPILIMAHPPYNQSDLSLEDFLKQVTKYNHKKEANQTKAAKLDFKSTEAVVESVKLMKKDWKKLSGSVWLNADILKGPVDQTGQNPVDAKEFFKAAKELESATLSLGWTSSPSYDNSTVGFTRPQIDEMLKVIKDNDVNENTPITFAVRALLAVNSEDHLKYLMDELSKKYKDLSFTIWSPAKEQVDAKKVESFIHNFGIGKVYVDVPEDLLNQIHVDKVNGASSLVQFGVLNMITIAVSLFFRTGLH